MSGRGLLTSNHVLKQHPAVVAFCSEFAKHVLSAIYALELVAAARGPFEDKKDHAPTTLSSLTDHRLQADMPRCSLVAASPTWRLVA